MEPIGSAIGGFASTVGQALIKRLLKPPPVGAALPDDPVNLSGWVAWRDGKRELAEREITKLVRKLELRATDADHTLRFIGPERGERIGRAVTSTLMALERITMDDVQAASLEPQRLATTLIAAAGPTLIGDLDSEAAVLYEQLLNVACLHILEFFSRRPEFLARTTVEQSRRLREIQDAVARLEEASNDDARFYAMYVKGVVVDADQMQLFGLRLPASEQTYELSTAYTNLSVKWDRRRASSGHESNDQPKYVTAGFEHLLGDHDRILLEGPAGAGKTTLLRRLALLICRGDLPPQMEDWRFRVPLLLRLRRFVVENDAIRLPSAEDFVAAAVPVLAGAQPHGWVTSVLHYGQGVVLLDGIDELPRSCRGEVLEWLEDLIQTFPHAQYVVTSRPSVVGDDWRERLRVRGFTAARLEPMTRGQVREFIDRWHVTVLSSRDDQEGRLQLAESLKNALTARRDLARLATNPLLCAMLCALNRNNNEYLPRTRAALYDDVLTMMLERRDEEQRINAGPVRLSRQQAQPLLSAMAIWMTVNGRRAISTDNALRIIEEILPRFRGLDESDTEDLPSTVLTHLIERSGLLQVPSTDQIEFIHPSLQDYLAAYEVFRQNYIPHLLRNAHDPLYHDVIIMAVAQTQDDPARQRELLSGLIHRADAESNHARRLWLLSAACVADIEMVDREFVARIQSETGRLLPPADLDEADSIARAGEFVLDLLGDVAHRPNLTEQQVAGIIRAAGRIGGEASIPLISQFRHHASSLVHREIVDAWQRTPDPRRFATEALANSAVTTITLPDADLSSLLSHLTQLKVLVLTNMTGVDWGALAKLSELQRLWLSNVGGVDMREVVKLDKLCDLKLSNVEGIFSDEIIGMIGLEDLTLSNMWWTEWRGVSTMVNLRHLTLSNMRGMDWQTLIGMTDLQKLTLSGMEGVHWGAVARLNSLRYLELSSLKNVYWDAVATMTSLRTLKLSRIQTVDWDTVAKMCFLQSLDVSGVMDVDLPMLAGLTNLTELDLRETRISDVTPIAALRHLQRLDLRGTRVEDVSALSGLKKLTWLALSVAPSADLQAVAHVRKVIIE